MRFLNSIHALLKPRTSLSGLEQIQWYSYHIPKTAGSSLRHMLYKEFGSSCVHGVYEPQLSRSIGQGEDILIPTGTKVLHGHFKPHPTHRKLHPNMHSMVWVRDPVERIWSLVGHLMDAQHKHPHYKKIFELYVSKGIDKQADIVERIIKENSITYMTNTYSRFFTEVSPNAISFVGTVHDFSGSINKLNDSFGLCLTPQRKNIRSTSEVPKALSSLRNLMDQEYNLVDEYL